jgi:hypothetical protein
MENRRFLFLLLFLVGFIIPFFGTICAGAKESVDRWEMCIVTTQKYFRLAMGSIYSKNNVALKDSRNGVSIFFPSVIALIAIGCLLSTRQTQQCNPSALMSCLYSIFLSFPNKNLLRRLPLHSAIRYPREIGGDHLRITEERLG